MATSLFRSALKGGIPKNYLRKTIRAPFNVEKLLCIHTSSFLNGNMTFLKFDNMINTNVFIKL